MSTSISEKEQKYTLINPYDLLGFDSKNPNITMKALKSSYYTLSLICHPDKGGNKEDMIILEQSYQYIKKQLENASEHQKTIEQLEEEFKTFIENQEKVLRSVKSNSSAK